jgi:hypothetical protein
MSMLFPVDELCSRTVTSVTYGGTQRTKIIQLPNIATSFCNFILQLHFCNIKLQYPSPQQYKTCNVRFVISKSRWPTVCM